MIRYSDKYIYVYMYQIYSIYNLIYMVNLRV